MIRDEQAKRLKAIRPLAPGNRVRRQYEGYRDEGGVAHGSDTETFWSVVEPVLSHRDPAYAYEPGT